MENALALPGRMVYYHNIICMDFQSYKSYFNSILSTDIKSAPYTNPEYFNYATLNWFRQQRWLERASLNRELTALISQLPGEKWIFITEPWCGDAAHILPFIFLLVEFNPSIILDIRRRDVEPFIINDYLSGHSKSIPKFIIRSPEGQDLFIWGSRPIACQQLYDRLIAEGVRHDQLEIELQRWYNRDKGVSFQMELLKGLKDRLTKPEDSKVKNSLSKIE